MTVAELIAELQKMPQEAVVYAGDDEVYLVRNDSWTGVDGSLAEEVRLLI